jgi:hypothetical protein
MGSVEFVAAVSIFKMLPARRHRRNSHNALAADVDAERSTQPRSQPPRLLSESAVRVGGRAPSADTASVGLVLRVGAITNVLRHSIVDTVYGYHPRSLIYDLTLIRIGQRCSEDSSSSDADPVTTLEGQFPVVVVAKVCPISPLVTGACLVQHSIHTSRLLHTACRLVSHPIAVPDVI